jgi:hypothetical protein
MNLYPSILITSNDKNIRFGALPVRADIYGLNLQRKLPAQESKAGGNLRPAYYLEKQFGDIFWKMLQLKNDLSALVLGGGGLFGIVPTDIQSATQSLQTNALCGTIIDNFQFGAQALANVFSNRIFKSTVYLKEAYLNDNTKSVILGKRVLIRDKFLLDEKTKKLVKKIYYNGVPSENFNQSFAANKVAFTPTNNHMVAGGPLFKTSFSGLKSTDIIAYINQVKLFFKQDLEELKNNPSLDPDLLLKRTNEINNYINNLQSNLIAKSTSYITVDFSDYITTIQRAKEPYYKGKSKSILGEEIKYNKNKNIYWPYFEVTIGQASNTSFGTYVGAVLFNGASIPLYSYPFGYPECFYPYADNYYAVNGYITTAYQEYYAPTPVYTKKKIIAGDLGNKK